MQSLYKTGLSLIIMQFNLLINEFVKNCYVSNSKIILPIYFLADVLQFVFICNSILFWFKILLFTFADFIGQYDIKVTIKRRPFSYNVA